MVEKDSISHIYIYILTERKETEKENRTGTQEPANESTVRRIEGEDSSSSALLLLRDVHAEFYNIVARLFVIMFRIFPMLLLK